MKLLKEYIQKNGKAIGTGILKVDSFLNHQIDPNLMMAMGEEFKRRFEKDGVNKILTIEASGIAIGLAAAYAFNIPLVFAKKKVPSTMGDFYTANVYSFTKNKDYTICVSKEFLHPDDRVLIIASDSTLSPFSLRRSPPFWNPFSTAIPAPTTFAPACSTKDFKPKIAFPIAKKSSIIRILSSECKNSFETQIV